MCYPPFGRSRGCRLLLLVLVVCWTSCSRVSLINEAAYVVPDRVRVRSAVAEASRTVGELKTGDKVTVSDRAKSEDGTNWSKINGPDGQSGWIETRHLVPEDVATQSRKLADEIKEVPAQAIGKSKATLKLRLSPDRTNEENVTTTIPAGARFEIVARERKPRPSNLPTAQSPTGDNQLRFDEWFKVRLRNYSVLPAGWIYGGSVELDIPGEILYFNSTDRKIIGWQRIATLKGDDSKSGDHYLVVERKINKADERADFDRITVLAYNPDSREYGRKFKDEVLGRFPIELKMEGTRGAFRVPALDPSGQTHPRDYTLEMRDGGDIKVTKPAAAPSK
jgi:Bacterial SH3 domain